MLTRFHAFCVLLGKSRPLIPNLVKEDLLKKLNRMIIGAAALCLLIISLCSISQAQAPQALAQAPLSDFQKEAIASIREITLQLILIAIGVFAVIGGFATGKAQAFKRKYLLIITFILLAASVISGLLAYGNLIFGLGQFKFAVFGEIANLAAAQWICFALGGLLFMISVLLNVT